MDLAAPDDTRLPRRRGGRLAAGIAACALVMLVLAGCSAAVGGASSGFDGPAGGAADGGDGADDGGGDGETDGDRSIVVEGWMSITVDDVAGASAETQRIVARSGGRVEGRDESAEEGAAWSTLELRVPADALDQVVGDLRELGDVDRVTTTSSDVTDAVRDVDARVDALEGTLVRLRSFQAQSSTVDDLLEIEREVSARQAELEKLRAEQASLSDHVQFSSLSVELHSEGAAAPAPDTFGDGFAAGWSALVSFVGVALVVLGALLPWLLVAGAVTLIVVWIVRALRRRRAARARLGAVASGPASGLASAPASGADVAPESAPQPPGTPHA